MDGPTFVGGYIQIPTGLGLRMELEDEVAQAHLMKGGDFFEE
jgi:hypothetical protein